MAATFDLGDAIDGLDRRALDRARWSRDPRFDGRFFIGVTSTGIYCRPICPSPTSKRAHVRYYASAAAAEAAGFRACLRCRPAAAQGTPGWRGTAAVVQRALRLIEEGALNDSSADALALRVGLGARHLDRLFLQHVGASPLAIAHGHRLCFAREMLECTERPMTEIALASGFGSVRRFNHAIRKAYGGTPRELRARGGTLSQCETAEVVLRLGFRPPYDWATVLAEFAAQAVPCVERIDAESYARIVAQGGHHAIVHVRPLNGEDALELRVSGARPTMLLELSTTARRAFDLAPDTTSVAAALGGDPLLAAGTRLGLRIAGAWSPFECAVSWLLAQDLRKRRATLARLVESAGCAIDGADFGLTRAFPSPAALAHADLEELGLGPARTDALRALARSVESGALDFDAPAHAVTPVLSRLPGFDASGLEDFALRALGDPDAFPADELAASIAGNPDAPQGAEALVARAEAWRPWRSYATLILRRASSTHSRGAMPDRRSRGPAARAWPLAH
jgi:AraC family transcriptional regulator of adaptative response / DNA-3-methyladenine glycosylase II